MTWKEDVQPDYTKARIRYSKALAGYEKIVGPEHPKCQSLQEILQDLETKLLSHTKLKFSAMTRPSSNHLNTSPSIHPWT